LILISANGKISYTLACTKFIITIGSLKKRKSKWSKLWNFEYNIAPSIFIF